jgi:hypothetical protein
MCEHPLRAVSERIEQLAPTSVQAMRGATSAG